MTWYCIRTAPGAQMPRREYAVETTLKGYRIVPSLDPNVSAIERALSQNGFVHYMPMERRIVRDRRRTDVWATRRFPLLPGYCFVADVTDFRLLEDTAGVAALVGIEGTPSRVRLVDILDLRAIEAEVESEMDDEICRRMAKEGRVTRSTVRRLFPTGSRVEVTVGPAMGRLATITGQDRGSRLKAIADGLDALGTISVSVDSVRLVA